MLTLSEGKCIQDMTSELVEFEIVATYQQRLSNEKNRVLLTICDRER